MAVLHAATVKRAPTPPRRAVAGLGVAGVALGAKGPSGSSATSVPYLRLITPAVSDDEATRRFPDHRAIKPYLRLIPQPGRP